MIDHAAFKRLVWHADRVTLGDLVFRLERTKSEDWDGGPHFLFHKDKQLVGQYERFFGERTDFDAGRVIELGIFDGGSIAFWDEILKPSKHIAIDLNDREDSDYFRDYVGSRGLSGRVKTFWRTDQSDKDRLREIVRSEFGGPLDLVIDDASHLYLPTVASFEALFPSVRPGGLYLIEDWAWVYWPGCSMNQEFAGQDPLTKLVFELVELVGADRAHAASGPLISNIKIHQGFIAIERGPGQLDDPEGFRLQQYL